MVMPNKVVEAKAAAGAGTEEGRRPTVVPAPAAANPELSDRPKRRTFTTGEKLRRHCHGNGGAPSGVTIICLDAADLVRPPSVPTRHHPADGLEACSLHAQPYRC